MADAVNIAAMEQFCKEYRAELLTLATWGARDERGNINPRSTMNHVTVLPGIKDKYELTSLEFQKLLKPYKKDWLPLVGADLKPRVLETELGQVELEEHPIAYRKTWLGKLQRRGVNPTDHPFEQQFVSGIVSQVAQDIDFDLVWQGVRNPAGTTPGAVNDGFLKIIADEVTAGTISVANGNQFDTGAISASNALDQLKGMYRSLPKPYRSIPIKAYMSYEVYDAYIDDYQATVGSISYNTQFEQVFLEGSNRLCELVPLAGMGDSQRVIMTPMSNMFVGIDGESDAEQVLVRQGNNPKTIQFFLALNFGVQIGSLKAIMVNNQP